MDLEVRHELEAISATHVKIASQWLEVDDGEVKLCFDLTDPNTGRTWTWRVSSGELEAMHKIPFPHGEDSSA